MAQIVIRKLDEETKQRLRERAARHGHSMEAEAREILRTVVLQPRPPGEESERATEEAGEQEKDMGTRLREPFTPLGGIDLPDDRDRVPPEPPDFFRTLDEETRQRLGERAGRHGNSMEAEAREILREGVGQGAADERPLGTRLWELFAPLGGIDIPDDLRRIPSDPPPDFEE